MAEFEVKAGDEPKEAPKAPDPVRERMRVAAAHSAAADEREAKVLEAHAARLEVAAAELALVEAVEGDKRKAFAAAGGELLEVAGDAAAVDVLEDAKP
jgi:hypothetical protein